MSESLDPQLNDLAAALASLRPSAPALNRDRLLFNAGRASAPRSWFWRASAAVSMTAAAILAALLLLRPTPAPVVSIVYVQVPASAEKPPPKPEAAPTPAPAESEPAAPPYYSWPTTPYSRLEDRVLRWGLDGLAEPTPPAAPPETLDSLLRSL
jgi:hypothetical protein